MKQIGLMSPDKIKKKIIISENQLFKILTDEK